MNGFAPFVSATADAAANQNYFLQTGTETDAPVTGRACFRLSFSRKESRLRTFRLWFSNALDSTYGPGKEIRANAFCEPWEIRDAWVWLTDADPLSERPDRALRLTFDGQPSFRAEPGMVFACDPFDLPANGEHMFAFEWSFQGHILPCHTETLIPVFRKTAGSWEPDARVPLPVLIGERREGIPMLGFLGDSITQGIGAGSSANAFPALVQDALGDKTAVWNLGIGYARAADLATDGFWLCRAKQCETVALCLGVNDICQGFSAGAVCTSLKKAVLALRENGCSVLLLTPPPFDFTGEQTDVWEQVLYYCTEELSRLVTRVIRTDLFLEDPDCPGGRGRAKYGAHPDAEGHRLIADALVRVLRG